MEPVNETEESTGITKTHGPRHLRTSGSAVNGTLRSRRPESAVFLVFGIALASAIAGGLAHGSPTGISPFDVALRAVFGASLALAAISAAWPWLLAASIVAVPGSLGQPTVIPAAAALAIALGGSRSVLTNQKPAASGTSRLRTAPRAVLLPAKAVVGAVIAQVALRFGWPHAFLVPSVLAAGAALLVFVPGLVGAPRPFRRWVVSVCAAVLLLAVALTAIAGVSVIRARSPIETGLQATETGLHAAERGEQGVARAHFATARDDFGTASHDLAWARGSEIVPGVAQQVRAMRVAAAIGVDLARTAFVTAENGNVDALRFADGTFPVKALENLEPVLAGDVASLQSSLRQTGPFRSPWLVSPLKVKLDSEVRKLVRAEHDATTALLATRAVPGMLGADGPRRYLVLFENPVESPRERRSHRGLCRGFRRRREAQPREGRRRRGARFEWQSSRQAPHRAGGLPCPLQPVRTGGLLGERAYVAGLPVGG